MKCPGCQRHHSGSRDLPVIAAELRETARTRLSDALETTRALRARLMVVSFEIDGYCRPCSFRACLASGLPKPRPTLRLVRNEDDDGFGSAEVGRIA